MNRISLSREDLGNFAANHIGFCGLEISRISSVFIVQIMQMQVNQVVNTNRILREVQFLEGIISLSSTQAASPFKKKLLKGLMKKHFTDAGFLVKNLGAHFGYEFGGNKNLEAVIHEAFSRNKSGYVDDDFINYIAQETTVGAFEKRAKENKMTGEWIVFRKYRGKNYYLTLAAHDEGDENIYSRVRLAYDVDFQFLNNDANKLNNSGH